MSVDCNECRWNYIVMDDVVAGSSPVGSNIWGRSSVVEHVCFINHLSLHSRFRGECLGNYMDSIGAGSTPASRKRVV